MTDEIEEPLPIDGQALNLSYEFANCPITVNLQIFPEDGSIDGRRILMGIRNHQDVPIFRQLRTDDFSCVQQLFDELLATLKAELPVRLLAAIDLENKLNRALTESDDKPKKKSPKSKSKPVLPNVLVKPTTLEDVDESEQTKLNLFGE